MFKKLLKYDLLSVWKLWWVLAVSVLGLSTLAGFVLRFVIAYSENPRYSFFVVVGGLFLFVACIAVFGSIVVTQVLIYYRFYKNFYTDEGYLTFTLPVSRRCLYFSKLLNALIWQTLHILLFVVCIGVVLLVAPPMAEGEIGLINPVVYRSIGQFVAMIWDEIGAWLIVYVFDALLISLGVVLFGTGLIYFCITVGAVIAKKAKLLAAIGIYYVTNMVLSLVFQLVGTFGLMFFLEGFMTALSQMSAGAAHFSVSLALGILAMISLSMGLIINFMTLDKVERKLNLA